MKKFRPKGNFKKNLLYSLAAAGMVLAYFLLRLTNLTQLPIFTDEAIYIRWAQIAEQDAAWRFISLTDGKQPMLIWAGMIALKIFSDPLLAVRFVSVITGFFAMVGIGFLGRELFKSTKIGLLSAFLYLVSPFTLMYDRMALMDSMVAMFSVWSLYLEILLVKHRRLDIALILGFVLGGGVLTKTSGFFGIYLLPSTLLLFDFPSKYWKKNILEWGGLALVAVLFSQVYYNVLRLSPWFHMVAQKDTTFLYTLEEQGGLLNLITYTSRFWLGNLHGLADWAIGYLTVPVVMLVFIAVLFIHKSWREKLLLLIYFSAPFVGLAFFGKVLYPRFILFMMMPLLILSAWSLNYLLKRIAYNKIFSALLLILVSLYPLYVDSKIVFSIVTAPIPRADSGQYINNDPAGWGIREVVDFFENEAQTREIRVFTEGNFGLLPAALEIYLVDNSNIKFIGLWPIPEYMPEEMLAAIETYPTYYISNKFQELPSNWQAELIAEYQKGNNDKTFLRLYKLLGQKEYPQ